ncbi:MAG TPA: hypothetical protein VJQ55_00375, partial [Candidatus Binatia bacterium]|nr:hypothetical protein [Candidatus Binatia bacterium]
DCVYGFFLKARRFDYRRWYLFFLLLLTGITSITMQLNEPGTLILISAVIGFVGTVFYSVALIFLNHVYLPRQLPAAARPGRISLALLVASCCAYFVLAVVYLLTVVKVI